MSTFEARLTHPSGLCELSQLLGQAQQVVEVKKTASLEDVKGHLEALRAERDADIIEVDDVKLD